MDKFDDTETEKYNFYLCKNPILIYNIDINKIEVANRACFGKRDFKYFVSFKGAI